MVACLSKRRQCRSKRKLSGRGQLHYKSIYAQQQQHNQKQQTRVICFLLTSVEESNKGVHNDLSQDIKSL